MLFLYKIRQFLKPEKHTLKISETGLVDTPFAADIGDPVPLIWPVERWIEENCRGEYNTWSEYKTADSTLVDYFIQFQYEEDAMAFKLRWV